MHLNSASLSLHLKPRQIVSLPDTGGAGVSVSVTRGSVWITQDRDIADIVLEPGQSHASRRPGQMLIYGLSDADVEIAEMARIQPRQA
jgi:hypothetical protein